MALRGLWTFLSRGKQHRAGKQAARVYIPSDSLVAQGQWSLQASVCSWLIDRESGVAHLDSASLEMRPWHLRAREQVEEDVKEFCITTFSSTSHLMLTMIGNKIQHLACPVASSVICPSALLQCYLNSPSFSGLLAIPQMLHVCSHLRVFALFAWFGPLLPWMITSLFPSSYSGLSLHVPCS